MIDYEIVYAYKIEENRFAYTSMYLPTFYVKQSLNIQRTFLT